MTIKKLKEEMETCFEVDKKNNVIDVWEQCDYYFTTTLNKQELAELISELQIMHDQLKD